MSSIVQNTDPNIPSNLTNVLTSDYKTINVQSILFSIWSHKENPNEIKKYITLLIKFIDEKKVFDDIEFYLLQFAHITINLSELSETNNYLDVLLIFISQISIHTALQLSFILNAALSDNQPELSNGKKNPSHNSKLYHHCAKLLQNVETAVVFGPTNIGNIDYQILFDNAIKISQHKDLSNEKTNQLSGHLLYKRLIRKNFLYSKQWKPRYIIIDKKILYCYHDINTAEPLRTIPLYGTTIEIPKNSKHNFYFELYNVSSDTRFQFRANSQEEFDNWINAIKQETDSSPPLITSVNVSDNNNVLTEKQRIRYKYFHQQRNFITTLTDICERLRFLERDVRKDILKKDLSELIIPKLVYLPLYNSTDKFQSVIRTIPSDCHAFSTKARCPALMLFEVEEYNESVDYATFLSTELTKYSLDEIVENKNEAIDNLPISISSSKYTKLANSSPDVFWKEEGNGIKRILSEIPISNTDINTAINSNEIDVSNSNVIAIKEKAFIDSELFESRINRLRLSSEFSNLPGWKIDGLIAKSNDDLRQEVFVMQLITFLKNIFITSNVNVFVYTYRIISTSKSTGLIELIRDAISLDGLKKKENYPGSLRKYFEITYRNDENENDSLDKALSNFVQSLAGYSIVTYLLAIKDRHNGNIMIDTQGHLIHIDFGFVFGLAPGKAFSMEIAPFKLNDEFMTVIGGKSSKYFKQYLDLCSEALLAVQKHATELITMIDIMMYHSNYPSFRYNPKAILEFRSRLHLDIPDSDIPKVIKKLINKSMDHTGTDLYDRFQLLTNGIAK